MPDTPTPGEIAYVAYVTAVEQRRVAAAITTAMWVRLLSGEQAAWEAAAQAVCADALRHLRAVVNHWHEFGPEYGFEEQVHALEGWLQPREEGQP
jgi:hypothetical protein